MSEEEVVDYSDIRARMLYGDCSCCRGKVFNTGIPLFTRESYYGNFSSIQICVKQTSDKAGEKHK